jgi:hypothetical protein
MKQAILFRIVWAAAIALAMGWAAPVLAQRGGHSTGGGFHASGGFHAAGHGYVASGARYYGYRGYHGGRVAYSHGWHGGYWGYPRYTYGWGWGYGFGFGGPYWPTYAYPYPYPYAYYWGAPYPYYPFYYAPPNATYPAAPGDNDGAQSVPREGYVPKPDDNPPPSDPDNPTRETVPDNHYATVPTMQLTAFHTAVPATSPTSSGPRAETLAVRPEVRQAMRALGEMPPYAREREIEHGRYRNFSAQEKDLLRALR